MQETHDPHAWLRDIPGAIRYRLKQDYDTLESKAALLGLPEGRIAKSVYWTQRRATGPLYCAVVPADRDVDRSKLLAALRADHPLPSGICVARAYPAGQAPGRLGPFPTEEDVGRFGMIIYDADFPADLPLDFAHPTLHRAGFLATIAAVERALDDRFGDRVRRHTASIATPAWHAAFARACRHKI